MKNASLVVLGVALAALALPTAVHAAGEVAEASAQADGIAWQPLVGHDGLLLTVSRPDGVVDRQEFRAGQIPSYSIFDRAGQLRPDGPYVWELRVRPQVDAATQAILDDARRRGDDAVGDRLRAEGRLPVETVQSGSFSIVRGEIVAAGREEVAGRAANAGSGNPAPLAPAGRAAGGPVARDQVIPDDLIVQGSACVGLDCVNNENFGFDTIRLKENNLRIHFDDTSTQAGFPANDWRLVANDSASGGQNKFSIEDSTGARTPFTVEAGATTNSIYTDSSGRVGFRTSTPVLDLHVNTSNTPALRLEQNNSGGFTAQTWDVAGNEANFFVRDVTGGSRLSLRIRPGAPTSSLDISADGDVGVGTGSPDAPIHVVRDGATQNASFLLENTAGTVPSLWFFQVQSANGAFVATPNSAGTNAPLKIFTGAPENSITIGQNGGGTSPRVGIHRVSSVTNPIHVGTDTSNGNGAFLSATGTWTNGSSRVDKTDVVELDAAAALAAVMELNPVRWKGKHDPAGEEYVGFIAEDVPELVAVGDRTGVSPMDIVGALTKVVQTQQREKNELAARVAELEAVVRALQTRLP